VQEAEFVAFRVGQDVPALGAGLADVDGPGAEREQPLQLGVLVAVGGVDVDVQPELPGPRVAAGAEDEGGLRAAEAGVGRLDLDASVVLQAEFDVAEDLAPECGSRPGSAASMTSSLMRHAMPVSVRRQPGSRSSAACWRATR
jgi:hypothetical protein